MRKPEVCFYLSISLGKWHRTWFSKPGTVSSLRKSTRNAILILATLNCTRLLRRQPLTSVQNTVPAAEMGKVSSRSQHLCTAPRIHPPSQDAGIKTLYDPASPAPRCTPRQSIVPANKRNNNRSPWGTLARYAQKS